MKVFISWSGELSRRVAIAIREWLPDVLQSAEPYVSSEDIRKGNRWSLDIAGELEVSGHGIICLTKENLGAPWIHFEAGALSKSVSASSLWTLLVDVEPADVQGPLAQFQHTALKSDDVRRLLGTINERLGEQRLPEDRLDRIFEKFWPELAERVAEAQRSVPLRNREPSRSERAILEELLDLSRSLARTFSEPVASESETKPHHPDNFRTTVTLVPEQDEDVITTMRERIRNDSDLRSYGIVALGGGGVSSSNSEFISTSIWVQSYKPLPRKKLLQLAAELAVEVIDVTYGRIVF